MVVVPEASRHGGDGKRRSLNMKPNIKKRDRYKESFKEETQKLWIENFKKVFVDKDPALLQQMCPAWTCCVAGAATTDGAVRL